MHGNSNIKLKELALYLMMLRTLRRLIQLSVTIQHNKCFNIHLFITHTKYIGRHPRPSSGGKQQYIIELNVYHPEV
jgi:hypothetical protein